MNMSKFPPIINFLKPALSAATVPDDFFFNIYTELICRVGILFTEGMLNCECCHIDGIECRCEMIIEVLILTVTTILLWLYVKMRQQCQEFDKAGVRYLKPYPILGNMLPVVLGREHVATILEKLQKEFPEDKYFGIFNFVVPVIVIQDLNIIRDVTVKDFSQFPDHSMQLSDDVEPLFGKSLVNLKGQKWREMRANLSPAFTSSKMRNMYGFIVECANKMTDYYKKLLQDKESTLELEARSMVTKFTTDVIASTAFGLDVDSHKEHDNQFFKMGQFVSYISIPKFLGFITYPKLMKFFRVSLLPEKCCTFFKKLVKKAMADREANNIHRPDMIHLLMEVKKGSLKDDEEPAADEKWDLDSERQAIKSSWTDDDLAAQAMLFFLAGFEAATISSNYLFYMLLSMPEIQEKLYKEIMETCKEYNDNVTYEVLHKMEYMDMVISEILRRYPSGSAFMDRSCGTDYILPPSRNGGKEYKVTKGSTLWISSANIHGNASYWPEPEKFIPERFSEENKRNIIPFSYIPFGTGPRICIGNRFALMELKILAFYIVKNFKIIRSPKTRDTLEIEPTSLNIRIKGGVWFNLKARYSN